MSIVKVELRNAEEVVEVLLNQLKTSDLEGITSSVDLLQVFVENTSQDSQHYRQFLRVSQKLSEVGMVCIIDDLMNRVDPDPSDQQQYFWEVNRKRGINCATFVLHTIHRNFLYLISACLYNTAAIAYLMSRRQQVFAKCLNTLRLLPKHAGTTANIADIFAACLLRGAPQTLPRELISKYNILAYFRCVCEQIDKTVYTNDDIQILGKISYVCYLLVVMGDADCRLAVQKDTYRILTSYGFKDKIEHVDLLHYAFKLKGFSDMQDLKPCERIPHRLAKKEYYVFCSAIGCEQMETTDGVLKHCALCRLARYCSKECQTEHWSQEHSKQCIGLTKGEWWEMLGPPAFPGEQCDSAGPSSIHSDDKLDDPMQHDPREAYMH